METCSRLVLVLRGCRGPEPFGGVLASGTGSRFGGTTANIEAFTENRWITARRDIARYPF